MERYYDENLKLFEDRNKANALNESYDEIKTFVSERDMNNSKFNVITVDGKMEVKNKQVSDSKLKELWKKTAVVVAVALGLSAGTIMFADVVNHPEGYMTTHPEFEGAPSISEILDRTPENFGLGGR